MTLLSQSGIAQYTFSLFLHQNDCMQPSDEIYSG